MKFSRAFTIIELVFVIVVLGILTSIALPKLSDTVVQADIAKGRGDVATIRSAIANERQGQVIRGITTYIPRLTPSTASTTLFTGDGAGRTLLLYGITKGTDSGEWNITGDNVYTFTVGSTSTTFTYNPDAGTFTCPSGTGNCNALVD
ncbi:MAG: prepilin-type N-terminal cleavage/methylation domain-containing protein [Sulfurimonas sp.]|uniref:type II secretion system protein n=1 Tax=Sulfurimonas sp. TaxID=2022749 RepID=UPI0028CC5D0E|nr:prepilin-type N-terminal cleavage/methylation domain-containing protein [Sulfurimonas sp.]MDT8338183.1 prepilin-type N-terminal cleavage/methylation domain-containing protein [Sulfurimonas sp.]